jgi:SHS2 domain-containing protein
MKRHNEHRQQKILFAMLREIYLLKDQSHFVIKKFSEVVQQQDEVVRAKQQLYREGDPADYVYIVVRGSFLITKKVVKNATTHQLFDENFDPKTIKVKLKAEDVDLKAAQIKEKLKIKVDRWQL